MESIVIDEGRTHSLMIDSVLLIRPPAVGKKETPFGLLYVGTALKKKGYAVRIIDLQDERGLQHEILDILTDSPNTILGINALAPHYRWVKRFTLKLKSCLPCTKIVAGGHIAVLHKLLLTKTGIDFVCIGEGEEVMSELIERLNTGHDLENLCGMAFRKGDAVVRNRRCKPVNFFLMPDYDLVNVENYLIHPSKDMFFANSPEYNNRSRPEDKLGVLMFSRGCTGYCGFCYRHLPGFRQGSIDWCWEHLMTLYEKYNVKYFRFDDELLTNSPEWLAEFHRRVTEAKLDILFRVTGIRVDSITAEQLNQMREMGCIAINYGIESGSQTILNRMRKGVTVEQGREAVCNTLQAGMQVMAYIIMGYEHENTETLKNTVQMLLNCGLPPEYVSIFYAVPLPGTKLYRDSLKAGRIKDEEDYLDHLAAYIEEKREPHEYYFVNVSDTSLSNLVKWEKAMMLLLKLNQMVGGDSAILKLAGSLVDTLPAGPASARLLNAGYRVVRRLHPGLDWSTCGR